MSKLSINQISNLGHYCVAQVKAGGKLVSGSWDAITDNCSTVSHDQSTYYYDFGDHAPTLEDFKSFVQGAWDVDGVDVILWTQGVYKASLN